MSESPRLHVPLDQLPVEAPDLNTAQRYRAYTSEGAPPPLAIELVKAESIRLVAEALAAVNATLVQAIPAIDALAKAATDPAFSVGFARQCEAVRTKLEERDANREDAEAKANFDKILHMSGAELAS